MTYDAIAAATKGAANAYGVTLQTWVRFNLQVLDSDGDPLPGVTVTVGGATLTTDAEGRIAEQHLAVGEYEVTLALAGYATRMLHYNLDRWRSDVEMMDIATQAEFLATVVLDSERISVEAGENGILTRIGEARISVQIRDGAVSAAVTDGQVEAEL